MSALLLEPEMETLPASVLLRGVSWEQYEAIDRDLDGLGVGLAYLDGTLEIMSPPISEEHEFHKSTLGHLIGIFCLHHRIRYWAHGSASLRMLEKAGLEPDEQFHFHEKKDRPDLAIGVIFTSGGIDRLELLHPFGIPEIWIWKQNQLTAYAWTESGYEAVTTSRILPNLDIALMERCARLDASSDAIWELRRALEQPLD